VYVHYHHAFVRGRLCRKDEPLSIRQHGRDQCRFFCSSATLPNTQTILRILSDKHPIQQPNDSNIRSSADYTSQALFTNNTKCLPTNLNREAGASATSRPALWNGASSNTSPTCPQTLSSSPSLVLACLFTSTRATAGSNGRLQH
jgi:hypothetical protein